MAQIPTPQAQPVLGDTVAAPGTAVSVPQMDTSSGAQRLADTAEGVAQDYRRQQVAAQSALALATATNQLHDAHDQVAQGVQDGTIAPQDAQAELQKRVGNVAEVNATGLPQAQADALRAQMMLTSGALSRSLNETVFKYQQSQTAATIDQTGTQLQQDAQRRGPAATADTYDAIMDLTGASAGFSPEQIAAKKTAFRQSTTAGYFLDKAAALHAARDLPGITSTLNQVLGADGDTMAPVQRAEVTNKLVGLQNQILAEKDRDARLAEAEQLARENAAADAWKSVQGIVLNGQYLSADEIARVSAITAGTSYEKQTTALFANQGQAAGFAAAPADQRATLIARYEAEASNPAVGTSADNQKSLQLLKQVDGKINEAVKDNPWQAALTYGRLQNLPTINMGDTANALPLLDQRMQQIGQVEAWVGHKISPLQPREVEQLSETLKGLPPAQAAQTLSSIGQMVGDSDRVAAIANQLGKGMQAGPSREATLREMMAYAGDRNADGTLTGEWIMRGDQALGDRTAMVDQTRQSGWKSQIATAIRGAFSSQGAEDTAIDVAYKIAAANGGDVQAAIKMATGGIITHGAADAKIPLPAGMDKDAFESRIKAMTPDQLAPQAADGKVYVAGSPMPLADFVAGLPRATLAHAGQGLYVVKSGQYFVTNRANQRIVLKVTP